MFPFKIALNASTLFPFALDAEQQVRIAGQAGFEGIELWVKDLEAYLGAGHTAAELRAAIAESGVSVVNAIAFFAWADADPAARARGLAQAEREMELLADIGCVAVAAPPYGTVEGTTLDAMADHFAALVEAGRRIGVEPYLEFWGRAKKLSRLSEALYVAIESGVPGAKLLLDPFHMYTGGSAVSGLAHLQGTSIGIVHVNDYPAAPERAQITDRDRVLPGEGVALTQEFARLLDRAGYRGYLSLELFADSYGDASALDVARRGIAAIRDAYRIDG